MHYATYLDDVDNIELPLVCDAHQCCVYIDHDYISNLDDEALVKILRYFQHNSIDISAIESVHEYGCQFMEQYEHVVKLAASEKELAPVARDALEYHRKKATDLEADMREEGRFHKTETPTSGYIYLVGSESIGMFKIGMTTRFPTVRLAEFSPQLPFECKLLLYIETDNPLQLEAQLHQRFDTKRLRGEWFALDENEIETLLDIATWKAEASNGNV
jgi:hypothetical protein